MQVKVVGCHCHKCKTLQHSVRAVARKRGWNVEIQVINDPRLVHRYGDLATPALLINDELICSGQSLTPEQIEELWIVNRD